MNFLLITILAISSFCQFPAEILGTTEVQETPQALPLAVQTQPTIGGGGGGGEIWQEDDREVLIRNERGAKNNANGGASSCRYVKSPWTECDANSNTRSRTLTLKKGNEDDCVPTRTIQKKCKKACRYEKGSWSECTTGQMSRTDKLKTTSDSSCQATRIVNKNCNPGKSKDKSNKERKNKDKVARKGRQ